MNRQSRTRRRQLDVVSAPAGPMASVLAAPIIAYRRWVSPVLPARCRFYPSCSNYAIDALRTHGAVVGMTLATRRVLRCHPFHPGGYDPVPARRRTRAGDAR